MIDLEQWMQNNGWTTKTLADACVVSPATVREWLAGKNMPTVKRRRKINQLSGGTVYFPAERRVSAPPPAAPPP